MRSGTRIPADSPQREKRRSRLAERETGEVGAAHRVGGGVGTRFRFTIEEGINRIAGSCGLLLLFGGKVIKLARPFVHITII